MSVKCARECLRKGALKRGQKMAIIFIVRRCESLHRKTKTIFQFQQIKFRICLYDQKF